MLSYVSGICFLYIGSGFHCKTISLSRPKWAGNLNLMIGCASTSSSMLLQEHTYVGAISRHVTERVCGRGFSYVPVAA